MNIDNSADKIKGKGMPKAIHHPGLPGGSVQLYSEGKVREMLKLAIRQGYVAGVDFRRPLEQVDGDPLFRAYVSTTCEQILEEGRK